MDSEGSLLHAQTYGWILIYPPGNQSTKSFEQANIRVNMDGESSLLHAQTYGLILKYPRMKCLNRVGHRTIKPGAPAVGDLKEVSLVVGCV